MQRITISGFLSRDAETRSTQGGNEVTSWNVPVRQGYGDSEQTNWFRVNVWGKRAKFAGNGRKGDFVVATGELTIGEYNGKPQYEVRADDFDLRGSKREPDGSQGAPISQPDDDLADDIPFLRMGGHEL